eukprot:6506537-Ditylum_brightwellii.AAC.1
MPKIVMSIVSPLISDAKHAILPQVAKWKEEVKVLTSFARTHPQRAYASLPISMQAEWQYLQRVVPVVGLHMKLFGHSVKQAGLGIPGPTDMTEHCYSTSLNYSAVLMSSLLNKKVLVCNEQQKCVKDGSAAARKKKVKNKLVALQAQMTGATKM